MRHQYASHFIFSRRLTLDLSQSSHLGTTQMDKLRKNENRAVEDVEDQNDGDAGGSETSKKLIWEYELSRGRWIKYENAINKKLK
ncbi:unnamed protein product [Onchocerca ochengi]|uniref:WWE domain-containing protein n=1 Tax=Onchocerca ochengi TaxID=42157 RepID=A0A182EV99_ONCOC|nr:unnamed protein product [Onchocerca ochengi]